MKLASFHSDFRGCLRQASVLLGQSALPLSIDWDVQNLLMPRLKLEGRRGLDGGPTLLEIDDSPRGHDVNSGAERYRVEGIEPRLSVVRVSVPCATDISGFWAVSAADYRRLYRFIRRMVRESWRGDPPIMVETERRRLWDHTIGFLRRGKDVLRRFQIAARRGVLLQGAPGNGKTMACRWLRAQCRRHGMSWKRHHARRVGPSPRETRRHDPAAARIAGPGAARRLRYSASPAIRGGAYSPANGAVGSA